MHHHTRPLLSAVSLVVGLGLALSVSGGAAAQHAVDQGSTHQLSDPSFPVEFEAGGVDLEVDADGSIDYDDGAGSDLEVDADGAIDLETPDGVTLEIADGSYELEGPTFDFEGANAADVETVTETGAALEFEFRDGALVEFEVGATEFELTDGDLAYETADGPELTVTDDRVEVDGAGIDYDGVS